ncbi:MAG TPA: glycosyltransferase [Anaerolineales bacterium]|nr:glycosyltransferase [Anaerolineales bacterium]
MNILFIVPYVPNLIRVRSFNLIRQLAKRGNNLTVCTLWTDEHERRDADDLAEYPGVEVVALYQSRWQSLWNCIITLPSTTPLQAVYSWQPGLAARISGLLGSSDRPPFEVVHVEHLRGARFGVYVKSLFPEIPVVWDSVDCISYLFEQAAGLSRSIFGKMVTRLDLNRTRRYEGWLASRFNRAIITSTMDKQALLDLVPNNVQPAPIDILPNGVDWEYFGESEAMPRDPATVVFSGKMSYHANITMVTYLVNEIMPLVWGERPNAKLIIVGKDPPKNILALAQNPAITVTGTVPDLRPYLSKATLAVVPLVYGAGSQLKLLEAMACGTPVVASPRAIMALRAEPGKDLLVAHTPAEFAAKILELFDHPEMANQIGLSGRQYIRDHHRWAAITERLERVYQAAAQTPGNEKN